MKYTQEEKGFADIVASALLLVLLGGIVSANILFGGSVALFFNRNRTAFQKTEEALSILEKIVENFDQTVLEEYDFPDSIHLTSLRGKYADKSLAINDISSGIHLDFLPDSVVTDSKLSDFLFLSGTASSFLDFRNSRGLTVEKDVWIPFLKEGLISCCVSYGWLQSAHKESFAYKTISSSFGSSTPEELFPVVNDIPLINVNFADNRIFEPLLSMQSMHITSAHSKAESLKAKLLTGPVTDGELKSIIGLPVSHAIYRFLGVKTTFWSINFHNEGYVINAVIAAIPEDDGKTVKSYQLIERRIELEN
jgi:hypothetical protein